MAKDTIIDKGEKFKATVDYEPMDDPIDLTITTWEFNGKASTPWGAAEFLNRVLDTIEKVFNDSGAFNLESPRGGVAAFIAGIRRKLRLYTTRKFHLKLYVCYAPAFSVNPGSSDPPLGLQFCSTCSALGFGTAGRSFKLDNFPSRNGSKFEAESGFYEDLYKRLKFELERMKADNKLWD